MEDRTALFLAGLCRRKSDMALTNWLTNSLGNPESVIAALNKWGAWQAAEAAGIPVPVTGLAGRAAEVEMFGHQHGFPVVLKRTFGLAGIYVRICRNPAEVKAAWSRLQLKKNSPLHRLAGWREKIR